MQKKMQDAVVIDSKADKVWSTVRCRRVRLFVVLS
jgi:hypothetical protein